MRGILFKLLPLILLAGCAHEVPGIRTQIVEKPVLVVQKCIKKEDVPVKPHTLKEAGTPTDLESALSLSLAKVTEWERYGNKTDEIFKNCT